MLLATVVVNTVSERTSLGLITTLQGMGIVFAVLILLAILTTIVSKVVAFISKPKKQKEAAVVKETEVPAGNVVKVDENKEMIVDGVEDEETVAAIMAIVAFNTGSDLSSLKFNSIKAID